MKFQKTLLAAALAVSSFTAMAANQANITRYDSADNKSFIHIDSFANNATAVGTIQVGQWYEYDATSQEIKLATNQSLPAGFQKVAAGMVEVNETKSGTGTSPDPIVTVNSNSAYTDNVGQNNYWTYGGDVETTTTTTINVEGSKITLNGKLVNTQQNGNTAEFNGDINSTLDVQPEITTTTTTSNTLTSKKDIHIGNLTEVATGSNTNKLAKYDFTLEQNNAQGTLATVKELASNNTSVAGLTGKGLAVLDVAQGGVVDLEKGTVTFSKIEGDNKIEKAIALTSYKDKVTGDSIVSFGGKYYSVDKNKGLTEIKGDVPVQNLVQDGYGLADTEIGGIKTTSVNTGLVSNQNVTYGEKVTTVENAGKIVIASTDPSQATDHSGTVYNVIPEKAEVTTSKDVVTGIIATDAEGNKTYGLQATTVVDNKVTAQTTITAEGIKTTGTIDAAGFLVNGQSITSTVDSAVADATAVIDKKIVEVDSRLTQFNTTATQLNSRVDQLNKRIDDVEKTSYRGIAIALAAQQQIPNIGAGQFAVFGGAGHYEGESAAALGLASVLADGRTSFSAALGFAGGNEVGGRVGVSYVFGGK